MGLVEVGSALWAWKPTDPERIKINKNGLLRGIMLLDTGGLSLDRIIEIWCRLIHICV